MPTGDFQSSPQMIQTGSLSPGARVAGSGQPPAQYPADEDPSDEESAPALGAASHPSRPSSRAASKSQVPWLGRGFSFWRPLQGWGPFRFNIESHRRDHAFHIPKPCDCPSRRNRGEGCHRNMFSIRVKPHEGPTTSKWTAQSHSVRPRCRAVPASVRPSHTLVGQCRVPPQPGNRHLPPVSAGSPIWVCH